VEPDVLDERAHHFAEAVRFAIEHPWAVHHLQAATGELASAESPEALVRLVLQHGIAMTGADLGCLQVLDPTTVALHLVAYRGFDDELAARFAVVEDDRTVCARAAQRRAQVFVADVARDEQLVELGLAGGRPRFTALQSTPLTDFSGRVVGVLSTHWRRPAWSSAPDLRLLELYTDYAGDRLARLLGRSLEHTAPDAVRDEVGPVARAMLLALLDPPDRPAPPDPSAPLDLPGPVARAYPDDKVATFADLMVTGLFTAGLELDSARSTALEHHPDDRTLVERLSSATAHVDRMLQQVRAFMVRHVEEPEERS
jgi:hypothetical protein